MVSISDDPTGLNVERHLFDCLANQDRNLAQRVRNTELIEYVGVSTSNVAYNKPCPTNIANYVS
jgi:hypothetical protein